MTKSYDMIVLIESYQPGNESAIRKAVEENWDLECPIESWSNHGDGILEAYSCCSLYANDRPADFASRLAESVWRANGGYCEVGVIVVRPSLWVEESITYRPTPAGYRNWLRTGEPPYLGEASSSTTLQARAA